MLKFGSRIPMLWTATDKFFTKSKGTQLSTPTNISNIIIEQPPESRLKEVLDHVTVIFMQDEPLSKRFPPCTTGRREQEFHKYAREHLHSGLSLVATDGSGGPVVGACLNKVLSREDIMSAYPQEPGPNDDPLVPSVSHMLTTIHQQLDLFSILGLDEILDLGILSVDPKYTRRGIATLLMSSSMELAACRGIQGAKTDCSGRTSTSVALRAGMTVVFRLPYVNYTRSGRVVFQSIGDGNDEMTVLAARLQSKKPHVLPITFQPPCQ